jgi:hypothetical protein
MVTGSGLAFCSELLPALDDLDLALEHLVDQLVELHTVGVGALGQIASHLGIEGRPGASRRCRA